MKTALLTTFGLVLATLGLVPTALAAPCDEPLTPVLDFAVDCANDGIGLVYQTACGSQTIQDCAGNGVGSAYLLVYNLICSGDPNSPSAVWHCLCPWERFLYDDVLGGPFRDVNCLDPIG